MAKKSVRGRGRREREREEKEEEEGCRGAAANRRISW